MAPIHHHFEMKAWSETKIMVRFWIVCAILCAIGFVLYYRYYLALQAVMPRARSCSGSRGPGEAAALALRAARASRWSATTATVDSTRQSSEGSRRAGVEIHLGEEDDDAAQGSRLSSSRARAYPARRRW